MKSTFLVLIARAIVISIVATNVIVRGKSLALLRIILQVLLRLNKLV